jgi:hypothetical protein
MGVWGDEIFENDSVLNWLAIFQYKLETLIRGTAYGMKTAPNQYINEFHKGFIVPLYIYWILINKVTEVNNTPPKSIHLQQWQQDFNFWWTTAITDNTRESNRDYYEHILSFTSLLLDRLLLHANDFENDDFWEHDRQIDIGYLPKFEIHTVNHPNQAGFFIHYDIFDSLKRFVESSFFENTIKFESSDWKSSPTTDAVFIGAVKVMYLMSRYCRYTLNDGTLTTRHLLFEPPRAYILKQWKTAYRRYLKKYFSKEEIRESNYCQVRINLFEEYIQLAQEYEQLEEAEIEARRKGDKK